MKRYSELHVGVDGDELDNHGNKLRDNAADLLPINGVKKNTTKTKRKALAGCRAASKKRKTKNKTSARHTEPDVESLIDDSSDEESSYDDNEDSSSDDDSDY